MQCIPVVAMINLFFHRWKDGVHFNQAAIHARSTVKPHPLPHIVRYVLLALFSIRILAKCFLQFLVKSIHYMVLGQKYS